MPNKKIDTQKITQFAETISSANNIAITCHMSPDGDAIGACNAFCLLLNKLGKTANVITPDQAPYDLAFAPGYDNMTAYTRNPSKAARLIKNADLILVMKDGNIIEQGNHEELMDKKGFYSDLYNSQFEECNDEIE